MNESEREQPEPYSRPPVHKAAPKPARDAPMAILVCTTLMAGSMTFYGVHRRTEAPAPAPAAATQVRACRSYEQYRLDTRSPSVTAEQLREEAACLCAGASLYSVREFSNGKRRLIKGAACAAGMAPMPLGPEDKESQGPWIDEPGRPSCFCSSDVRELLYPPPDPG